MVDRVLEEGAVSREPGLPSAELPQARAVVMVAGDGAPRQRQRLQKPRKGLVLARFRSIYQIAGDHDQIGTGCQRIEPGHRGGESRLRIDLADDQCAFDRYMQIADLSNEHHNHPCQSRTGGMLLEDNDPLKASRVGFTRQI